MSTRKSKGIDYFSTCSLKLELFFDDHLLSVATGFFYRGPNAPALVTNWHVLAGRHPTTGQPLDKNGAIPNSIRFWFHTSKLGDTFHGPKMPLYKDSGLPFWLQHNEKGQDIDVALIPFLPDFEITIDDEKLDIVFYCVNDRNSSVVLNHRVGADAFVVGFPLGLSVQDIFPIWKRASIASEPEVSIASLPLFLIDTTTRPGMSGSPVYARQYGFVHYHDGQSAHISGSATSFLGVYSGRLGGDDEFGAQLGRVWPRSLIDEILKNGVVGSFQLKY